MFGQPNVAEVRVTTAECSRPLLTNVGQPSLAKDLLQSPYVLQVVAYHLKSTIGTVNIDSDTLLPVGALSLAAAAVGRIVCCDQIE